MNKIIIFLIWLVTSIIASFISQFAIIFQTLPFMINSSFFEIILFAELIASVQWFFAIFSLRMGNKLFNGPQLYILGYIVGFLMQIFSSFYIYKFPISIDDYVTMILLTIAGYISKMSLFG